MSETEPPGEPQQTSESLPPDSLLGWSQEMVVASGWLAYAVAKEFTELGWKVTRPGIKWLKYRVELGLDIGSALSDNVRRSEPLSRLRQADVDLKRAQQENDPELIQMAHHDIQKACTMAVPGELPVVRTQIMHITKVRIGSLAKQLMRGYELNEDEWLHYKDLLHDVMGNDTFRSLGIDTRYIPCLEEEFPEYAGPGLHRIK